MSPQERDAKSGACGPLMTERGMLVQQRRSELQAIAEKISEIESDADEHRYVRQLTSAS